jgi:hypothetical protein
MRARRRTPLRAACLICLALAAHAEGAAYSATSDPREKDVRRAEQVVAKLRLLDEAAARDDAKALRALAAKLYPGLFVTVADMRESDLKTDLDTSVFLYERVVRTWFGAGAAPADCAVERPDIYLPLCLNLRGGTARQLLLAKARLHFRWAEAVVKTFRGGVDAGTARALSELKAARENDLVIAARIVAALKPLEGIVNVPRSYADYQEHRDVAKVGFERLDNEFAAALAAAGTLLASMPRSPAFYHLSNARRGYSDGLFWQRKVYQSEKPVVSAHAFTRDPLRDLRLGADQVGYTAVINWKSALKHTRIAEQAISSSLRR